MNEFHDPELERMLGRASGAYPDANVAFETMRGRVRQVKRRRAMVASTAACVVLAGVVALGVRGSDDNSQVQPSHQGDTSSSMEVATTTPQTAMSTPNSEMTSDTTVAETTVEAMATDSGSPGGPGASSGQGAKGGTGGTGGKGTTTSVPSSVTASPITVPSLVQPTTPTEKVTTYSTKGGSISVQVVNRRMVLVGTSPSTGFTAHLNDVSGDRIRVEFTNGGSTYELQLELSNGMITSSSQNKGP